MARDPKDVRRSHIQNRTAEKKEPQRPAPGEQAAQHRRPTKGVLCVAPEHYSAVHLLKPAYAARHTGSYTDELPSNTAG
jgi:hypothetical protein